MDELVMYIVARRDLNMPPGKLAAQVGHAVQKMFAPPTPLLETQEERGWFEHYLNSDSTTKIVLQVDSLQQMLELTGTLTAQNVVFVEVVDEGRTCVEPNTLTCIGIQPMPKTRANNLFGKLKLYR